MLEKSGLAETRRWRAVNFSRYEQACACREQPLGVARLKVREGVLNFREIFGQRLMTRLAVIDHDPTVQLILERAFAGSEVDLSCADSAAAGWDLIQREHPDVVVLDVQLPDLSGLDLFQRIQAHDAALPVIFITS